MNYAEIKKLDIANGTGLRTSLFVSGCTHHCKGCFNAETWDFCYGKPFTADTEQEIIETLSPKWVHGLSVLGGEPFEPQNIEVLIPFLQKIRKIYPEKTIWMYSGYLYEDLKEKYPSVFELIDVLVDGEFVLEEKDISLKFKGSRNQRIICFNDNIFQDYMVKAVDLWGK